MKHEVFEEILHCVKLPMGELLGDGTTYRITTEDFSKINTRHFNELQNFDKFLALTNDSHTVVGGVLFYGSADIQEVIFPEFRGKHFMSAIHKNGILRAECYPKQKVTLEITAITSFDDFLMKQYLTSCIGITVSNLADIHKYFNYFQECDKFRGFQELSREEFLQKFS